MSTPTLVPRKRRGAELTLTLLAVLIGVGAYCAVGLGAAKLERIHLQSRCHHLNVDLLGDAVVGLVKLAVVVRLARLEQGLEYL